MMKKLFFLAAILGIGFACTNTPKEDKEAAVEEVAEIIETNVAAILESPADFKDEKIKLEGTVTHVCAHGGKRLFIIGDNPDLQLKITPNEKIGHFEKEMEGSSVEITGILKELKIDEAYIAQLEKEIKEGTDNEVMHSHSDGEHGEGEEHSEDEASEEKMNQINKMRSDLAETEEGYIMEYWVECKEINTKESAE